VVWSVKRKPKDEDDGDDENEEVPRGGLIQVWDSALLLKQEVPIMQLPLKQYALCLDRMQFMLIDVEQTCILMQIDHLLLKKVGTAHYQGSKGRPVGAANMQQSMDSQQTNYNLKLYFNEIQQIPIGAGEERVVDVVFQAHGDYLYVLTHAAVNCFSALTSYTAHNESQVSMSMYEESATSPQKTSPMKFDDGDDLENNGYQLMLKFNLPYQSEGLSPVSFLFIGNRRFVVGKSDGSLEVRYLDHTRQYDDAMDAQSAVVSVVEAHHVQGDYVGNPVALCSCDGWSSVSPGGHDYEFISIGGGDGKVQLWGLRSQQPFSGIGENDFSSVYSAVNGGNASIEEEDTDMTNPQLYDSALEVLGTFDIITEPSTKLTLKKHRKIWSGKSHACTFELASRKNSPDFVVPIRRQLVVCFGGMLAFLEAYQVHKELWNLGDDRSGKTLTAFNHGPPLSLMTGEPAGGTAHFQSSVLALSSDDLVNVLDPSTGQLLRQFDSLYIADLTKTTFNSIGDDSHFNAAVKSREGKPSCVYWCPIKENIIVGYSSGGVNYVGLDPEGSPGRGMQVDVGTTHDSAIKQLFTFQSSPRAGVLVTYLLVGDAKGKLSLWQISGTRKDQRLVWVNEAHTGAVVYAKGLLVSGEHLTNPSTSTNGRKMFVTACEGGVVKAWLQHDNGEFMLSSFFKTHHGSISSFCASLVVISPSTDSHQESMDQVSESGNKTVLSALMKSMDGSREAANKIAAEKSVAHLICLCGLQTGILECWVLSNSEEGIGNNSYVLGSQSGIPVMPQQTPQWILPCHESPIVSLMRMRNTYEDLLHSGNHAYLAMSESGSALVMHISTHGELIQQRGYFSLPLPSLGLLPCCEYGDTQYDEFFAFSESKVVEISASVDNTVSSRWAKLRSNIPLPIPPTTGQLTYNDISLIDEVNNNSNQQQQQQFDTASIPSSHDKEAEEVGGVSETKEEMAGSTTASFLDSTYGGTSTLFADSTVDEKDVTVDLFNAKKDVRLLDLFRQSERSSLNQIPTEAAIDIVLRWINTDDERIKPENVWEIVLLLGLSRDSKLPFMKVAKIAALCSKVAKRQLKKDLSKLGITVMKENGVGNYRDLKKKKANVTYNQLGEMSVEPFEFVDSVASGVVRGNCQAYHDSWKNQGSRVMGGRYVFCSICSSFHFVCDGLFVSRSIPAYLPACSDTT
jgi:hypothetical protein